MKIQNSGFIVSGGQSGMGYATATVLRESGARVGVIDFNNSRRHTKWDGPFAQADVSDEKQVAEAFAKLMPEIGILRGMINTAGGHGGGLCVGKGATLTVEKFRRALEVNTLGSFIMSKLAAEEMIKHAPNDDGERGVLINTTSITAQEGQIGLTGYAASKGGVEAMTLMLAREFARFGIRVMTISPGLFAAGFGQEAGRSTWSDWLDEQIQFPNRLGTPQEYAMFAKHIVENPMLNGTTIRLDGAVRVGAGTVELLWPDAAE